MVRQLIFFLSGIFWIVCAPFVGAVETLSPDAALEQLVAGNNRFTEAHSLHPNQDAARRSKTTTGGQHPIASVIGCSDSRVVPELLFDQGIGDLFVIRVAGNVCDSDEIGSIEYGVGHLKTPLLVVLGHSNCGAVTAVVTGAEVHGSIPGLVDNIVPAVKRAHDLNPQLKSGELIPVAVRENVWQAIEDLFHHSRETRELVEEGALQVVGAVYDIESGKVDWMGKHPDQIRLLQETKPQNATGHESKKEHE